MMSSARKAPPNAIVSAHRLFIAFLFLMISMIAATMWVREAKQGVAQGEVSRDHLPIMISTAPITVSTGSEPSK